MAEALKLPDERPREPAIPYAAHDVTAADERAVLEVLRSDRLAQGPEAARFEATLAERAGVPFAVTTSSGTAALHVALAALGIGPGDEVIVPSLSFLATANAVLFCGATPVFADVDPETLCLCPDSLAERVGPRTRGAVVMHFGGHPGDTDALWQALGPDRFLLEDACHALGASWLGRPAGSLGAAACFSFHPAKLVTSGEGGAVVTASEGLARLARSLREHGVERDPGLFAGLGLPSELADEERGSWVYEMHRLSPNYRLPELSAALGRSQLTRCAALVERRRAVAAAYAAALGDCEALELPAERVGARSAWHLYAVRLQPAALRIGRAELFERLRARGIGSQVHYIPIHLQPYYRRALGTRFGMLPVSEREYLRLFTLPLFPAMTDADIARVVSVLRDELRKERR